MTARRPGLRPDTWHWLTRRRDGFQRMAFWSGTGGWRVSDAMGRTTWWSTERVERLFDYGRPA